MCRERPLPGPIAIVCLVWVGRQLYFRPKVSQLAAMYRNLLFCRTCRCRVCPRCDLTVCRHLTLYRSMTLCRTGRRYHMFRRRPRRRRSMPSRRGMWISGRELSPVSGVRYAPRNGSTLLTGLLIKRLL